MIYLRPRTVQASVLGISLILLVAAVLLVMGSVQAQGPRQSVQRSPELSGWDYPAKFVGQDHVDIKWEPDLYFPVWILYRDETELKRFDTSVTFYRDRGVAKGETHTYKMCGEKTPSRVCGNPNTVTVGQIRGLLYEYVSWGGDEYRISGVVTVQPGATLHIGGGATVVGTSGARIEDRTPYGTDQGAIQVDNATIQAHLSLSSSSSWVENSTIGGGTSPGIVQLYNWTGGALSGNVFTATGSLNISTSAGQEVQVHDNRFYKSGLTAGGAGEVRVHGNRFEKGSTVQIEGTTTGAVSGNTFHDSSISVLSSGYFDINNNRMRCFDPSSCGYIYAGLHAPNVGIYGNLVDGFMDGYYGTGVGISASADQDAGGIVDIHDNIITELEKGISLAGPIRVVMYNNTITHNRTGIYVKHWDAIPDPDVALTDNCISGNMRGGSTHYGGLATVALVRTVMATGNYWGSPSGPTHPSNLGGTGDRIQVLDKNWGPVLTDTVDFSGWLPAHHCSEVDLSVAGLEVVQSIQDLQNSVPLVAGKPTLVRVYADSGAAPEVPGVPVELKISRNGSPLATRQGTLTARPISKWDEVRASSDGGLAVRLDSEWLTGTLNLAVTLNAGQGIDEPSFDNNQKTYTVTFAARNPLHIGLAPIAYQPLPSVEPRTAPTEELPSLVRYLHKAYPVSEVRVTLLAPVPWPYMMKGSWSENPRSVILLRQLADRWALGFRAGAPPGENLDQIVGVFPADCEGGGDITEGRSYPRWTGGLGLSSYVCNNDPVLLAHEVGHNLGLYHPCTWDQRANCCQAYHSAPPEAAPLDWPYANASIQEFGYDAFENAVVLPVSADLMTYCPLRWLSPHYYRKLFQANGVPQPPVTTPPGGGRPGASGPVLLAGGRVDITGTVVFDPFWELPAEQPALEPAPGSDYCLEVRDAAQTVLHSRCFDLSFYNFEAGVESSEDGFLTTLPLEPAASRVVLRKGAVDLGQVVASAHAPQVTVVSPNTGGLKSGTISVQWTAQDADPGNELAFALSYSNDDGASWQPFAVNLTGTQSYDLDLASLPGGTACRVKVEVSDGWHTASDTSDASFQVGNKTPVAGILQPAVSAGAVVSVPLTLEGYGYDLEDGRLDGNSLAWSSDRDGPLGTGETVWDVDLSPGQHTLTLRATDSQGASRSVAVIVTVEGGEPALKQIYLPVVLRWNWR